MGWIVKEVTHVDGSKDYFYFNTDSGLSMWDPPFLRSCLVECLLQEGLNPYDCGIIQHTQTIKQSISSSSDQFSRYTNLPNNEAKSVANDIQNLSYEDEIIDESDRADDDYSEFFDDDEEESRRQLASSFQKAAHSPQGIGTPKLSASDLSKYALSMKQQKQLVNTGSNSNIERHSPPRESDHKFTSSPTEVKITSLAVISIPEESKEKEQESSRPENVLEERKDHFQQVEFVEEQHTYYESQLVAEDLNNSRMRDWSSFIAQHRQADNQQLYNLINRMTTERLPISLAGIQALRCEVIDASDRIHQLIIKLRSLMALKSNFEVSIYNDKNSVDIASNNKRKKEKSLVTLGSDIVSTLRQHPRFVVMAMKRANRPGSPAMTHIAFTAVHRLLHPFSTDNSMTAALLLQGFNSQLDEIALVEQALDAVDYKLIVPKALFIRHIHLMLLFYCKFYQKLLFK